MLRIVITVVFLDHAHSAHYPLHKHIQRKCWKKKKGQFLCFLSANFRIIQFSLKKCPSLLSRAFFHYRSIYLHDFHMNFPLVLPADDMWANAGLYSCSLVSSSSDIYNVDMKQGHQWELATCWEQLPTCCSTLPPDCTPLILFPR